MAKQEAIFTNGRIGNVIFYRWKGMGCARTAPRRIKQTKATKQSAADFGRAVQLSKYLRASLSPAFPHNMKQVIMYKLNAALLSWLRQEKPIAENISFVGLEFNDKSLFSERFRKELLVDFDTKGKVMIAVPRLKIPDDIVAPSHTVSVKLNIAVAGCMLQLPQHTDAAYVSINIPYKDGWTDVIKKELKFNCKAGSINVVAVSLHYITKKDGQELEIFDDRWTPVTILAAI
jgi:hypothetical protein